MEKIQKMEICDKELHSDIISAASDRINIILLGHAQFLIATPPGMNSLVTEHCHILRNCSTGSRIYQ